MISIGVPISLKGFEFQHLGIFYAAYAFIGVFIQKCIEDGPCLFAIFGEVVTFFDIVGPLLSGERGLIIGDMADQIKVAIVFADLFGKIVQDDAVLFQQFDDGLFFLGGVPALKKFIQRGEFGLNLLAGKVPVRFGNQVAIGP